MSGGSEYILESRIRIKVFIYLFFFKKFVEVSKHSTEVLRTLNTGVTDLHGAL